MPILDVLKRENPTSPFVNETSNNGVFDTDSSQTLYLWVDMKTNGLVTYPAVHKELEPLRSAGYLTIYSKSNGISYGPVTVIGTGNTPLSAVEAEDPRDVFYDANLPDLNTTLTNITSNITPIASCDFLEVFGVVEGSATRTGVFSDAQMALLNAQVKYASDKGIGARYWDTPGWPISTRNKIWATLWEAGVALINVDDLIAGAGYANTGNMW